MRDPQREAAACELVGYVKGMIKANDVPACHVAELQKMIRKVQETHGTVTVGDHTPETVS